MQTNETIKSTTPISVPHTIARDWRNRQFPESPTGTQFSQKTYFIYFHIGLAGTVVLVYHYFIHDLIGDPIANRTDRQNQIVK
jgi:hypothetical protein